MIREVQFAQILESTESEKAWITQDIPLEIYVHIFSFCHPSDLRQINETCHYFNSLCSNIDFHTRMISILARQGFVFDLIGHYIQGKSDEGSLETYVLLAKNAIGDERSSLCEYFIQCSKEVLTKLKKSHELKTFSLMIDLWILCYPYSKDLMPRFSWIVKNAILKLIFELVNIDSSHFIVILGKLIASLQSELPQNLHNEVKKLLLSFCLLCSREKCLSDLLLIENEPLWNDCKSILKGSWVSEIEIHHLYHHRVSFSDQFQTLSEIEKVEIFRSFLFPKILENDDYENLKMIYTPIFQKDSRDHFRRAYLHGADECALFLWSFLVREHQCRLSAILEYSSLRKKGWKIISSDMKRYERNPESCTPLCIAISYYRWNTAFKIVQKAENMRKKSELIHFLVHRFLNSHRNDSHKDMVKHYIKKCLNSVVFTLNLDHHNFLQRFFKSCFHRINHSHDTFYRWAKSRYRHPNVFRGSMIKIWAFSEVKHAQMFRLIKKMIDEIENQEIQEKIVHKALAYITGKPGVYEHPSDLQKIHNIPKESRREYFKILFEYLSMKGKIQALKLIDEDWGDLRFTLFSGKQINRHPENSTTEDPPTSK